MRSLLLVDATAIQESAQALLPWPVDGVKALAMGGRAFVSRRASMEGDCEAVWAWEASASGPPTWWAELAKEATEHAVVAGQPVFSLPRLDWGPTEEWYAIVDDRFLVRATRRWLLEAALRREGPPQEERLRPWGIGPDEQRDSPIVIVRLSDDTERDWPAGLRWFVISGSLDETFDIVAGTVDPAALQEWLAARAVTAIAEWVEGSARFRWADVIRGDPIGKQINICRLLGFRVFI